MFVEETLLVVNQAPLAHDTASSADDATKAAVCQVYVLSADAGMDGEVVNSLLTLLNQRVFVDFPCEVFYTTIHFFQCLIDRYSAHGNGAVADNPLACLVNVGTCRKVHQRVTSPFAGPYRLVHFFLNGGCGGGIANVRVDFYGEVAANNHRLTFWMVDVGWQHSTSSCNLIAHKLWGDVALDAQFLAVHVFADGYIFHFRSDDASFGIRHLRDGFPLHGASWQLDMLKAQLIQRMVCQTLFSIF